MGDRLSVTVLPDREAVHAEAARRFRESCLAAVRERGAFSVALAGGSTPRGAYERISELPGVPWEWVRVYFGDERCVPPDDERSNYRMAREALLDHVPIPRGNVHRVRVELGAEEAARDYEDAIAGVPGGRLDLVHLGVGPDGHVASLFPSSDLTSGRPVLVTVPTRGLQPQVERVSLGLGALLSARECLVMVTGADKAAVLQAAFAPGSDFPAGAVARAGSDWLVDATAAAGSNVC
ncbi:MAG TPA: 6-phosphogluconolactonase [Deinococcales bacterium]|nr:6-phosphogluconolactonase [Deinococcales bacterium]